PFFFFHQDYMSFITSYGAATAGVAGVAAVGAAGAQVIKRQAEDKKNLREGFKNICDKVLGRSVPASL
ncbi:MAG: hypothetical protein AABZ31_10240, partial [Bdellovibrionota bacterium]